MSAIDSVGFIGLGAIGAPMATRLLEWPGEVWVHDISATPVQDLVAKGARAAEGPAQLAERVDAICLMVRDDKQVLDVVQQLLATARKGLVIVIHSTIAPETAESAAERAAPYGVEIVDAPVSGGAGGAAVGRLAILCGGELSAIERVSPVLEVMGDLVVRCGSIGAGTRMKLARNMLHFTSFTAAHEAQQLAEASGLDVALLGEIVRHTDAITGGPGAIMRRHTADLLAPDDPRHQAMQHVFALGDKDLGLALELADRLALDVPLARTASTHLRTALGLPAEGESL